MSKQASLQHFTQRQAQEIGSPCSAWNLCIDSCSTPLAGSTHSCNPSARFLKLLAQRQSYVASVNNFSKCPAKGSAKSLTLSFPLHQLFKTIGRISKQGGNQSSFSQLLCNGTEDLDPSYLNGIITLEIPSS